MTDVNILYHVYISLALICLVISLTARNYPKKLWIYFLAVFVTDVYMYYGYPYVQYNIHAIAMAFYSLFFLWYYREVFSRRVFKMVFSIGVLISVICLFSISNPYDIKIIGLLISSFISLPLLWFHKEIKEINQNKITDKNLFWVSSGMIMWVTFFIFKMIPLYFLYTEDRRFLLEIDLIFQYVNIIFYFILLKSLFCKV
ncbi:hypothetical protein C1637_04660 [Chryseobacterium lactis]|uniref:Lysoplasmalogenase n=1 Tax=Chryseobacterium lactis TaxID=1241981 RepID=A0A3G6RYG4_CHRLC|nr:hypothetical protein EG342_08050 [Chryseobacterium lactis]AZB06866.1 hypothetical protein EG341_24165 [Chryseobacterium lactis]PNW15719.1 hypothetical protein C1637_04660 [Chryseobacterium lactis]